MALMKCLRSLTLQSKLAVQICTVGLPRLGTLHRLAANIRDTRLCSSASLPSSKSPEPDGAISAEVNKKLMEFFDDKKNWGASEVRVGRSWKKDELRLKSNTDLHKLWYVLLKEKNMLLSMEHESNEEMRLFPNPERLDKVEESMSNLEEIVRERNRAYHLLETGEDGERPRRLVISPIGIRYSYKMKEHAVPYYKNIRWWRGLQVGYENSRSVNNFLKLYREKLFLVKKKQRRRNLNHVQHLMCRFPHMDLDAVKKEYPEVDLEKARQGKRSYGSHESNS